MLLVIHTLIRLERETEESRGRQDFDFGDDPCCPCKTDSKHVHKYVHDAEVLFESFFRNNPCSLLSIAFCKGA